MIMQQLERHQINDFEVRFIN